MILTLSLNKKELSDFLDLVIEHTTLYQNAANWMNGEVSAYLNKENLSDDLSSFTKRTCSAYQ